MDRRATVAALLALLLLLWLGRGRLLDIITRSGGFDMTEVEPVEVELPGIVIPTIPHFEKGPAHWQQTTGLICACDAGAFTSPILVREIEIPSPPLPRYVNIPAPISARAAEPARSYHLFGMDSSYAMWGDRPFEYVYRGSDGRMFLTPKRGLWGELKPNPSWSNAFIGTDEYRFENGVIYYGPYQYHETRNSFMAGSA
jgi:hypothetical protein